VQITRDIDSRMESLQTYSDKFDHGVMDRFLNLSELPVIGTSALEQILHQASLDFNPAMSPDSSQWTASTSGVESGSESLDGRTESDSECLPDSTTQDNKDDDTCSVNSDPINSSGSEYSFAASPPVFEPVLHDETNNNNASSAQKRKSPSSDDAPSKKRSRKSKAGPNELACPLCEYTTRVKEHLASHMNSHTSDRKYMCNQCGQTFKWSHSLRRHQRTHQKDYKFTCAHCPKTFSRKDHLAVHEKLHDSDNTESYPCPECGVKFKNKKTLTGHVKTHSTDKPHKCDSCDSAFTRKASLTRHVLAAHAGHVFHCDICTAPFSYKSTLEDHRRAVHNEGKRDFHCTACGLSFACKAYLQKHLGVCKNRADKEDVPCVDCGKMFPTRRHLQEHRRNKHRENNNLGSVGSTPLPPPMMTLPPQNMGHNIGQYFTARSKTNMVPSAPVLPPFSRQPLTPNMGYNTACQPLVRPDQRTDMSEKVSVRCEVCHAFFPSELALEKHFASHWPQNSSDDGISGNQVKVTGNDLPLPQIEHVEENVGSILRQVYHTEHTEFGAHKIHNMNDNFMEYPSFDSFLYFNA